MHNKLSQWHSRISTQPIPILTGTVKNLGTLLGMRNIQIYDVLCIVEQDPGLAVQVLRSANNKNKKNNKDEVRSIEEAIKVYEEALDKITNFKDNFKDINEVVKAALHGMHDGLGLNRVVFYLLVKDHSRLQNYMSIGIENDPLFNKFRIDLTNKNIFVELLKKEQGIWANSTNNDKVIKYLPNEFHEMISIETFYTMSIFIENKPVGLFYADRHSRTCGMDEKGYNNFKKIAKQTAIALEYFHKYI